MSIQTVLNGRSNSVTTCKQVCETFVSWLIRKLNSKQEKKFFALNLRSDLFQENGKKSGGNIVWVKNKKSLIFEMEYLHL